MNGRNVSGIFASALVCALSITVGWQFGAGERKADANQPKADKPLAAEELPDRVITLPDNEIAPEEMVVIAQNAGDVKDWGHEFIGVPDAWKKNKGKKAKVAVLDTGFDGGHRDLKRVTGKDFTGSRSGASDVNGHGTHCLGIVGAAENGEGVVGVAPEAEMISGKVLGDNGSGLSSWIANGIDWAISQKVDVISMSLGSDAPDQRIGAAVKRALDAGIIVIAAAGNSGPRENTAGWPGSFEGVVCVGAIDKNGNIAGFSSRGKSLVVAAPGVEIRSCYPGDRFASMSGTSMATPYVAGCAALYVTACKDAGFTPKPADFMKALAETSKDAGPMGKDTAFGHGIIQVAKLLPEVGMPPTMPPTMPPPVDPTNPEKIVVVPGAPLTVNGRKVKQIVIELEKP